MRHTVIVKPRSKKGPLVEVQKDGSLVVFIQEPAVDGKANVALIRLLANYFGVSKTNVSIVHGHTSRHKIIDVLS